MGGAEEYVNKKIVFLQNNGYLVYVFSSRRGKIIIPNFRQYEDGVITCLGLPPYVYSKRFINNTINVLLSKIDYSVNDEVYIESNVISLDLWAEIFAKKTNGEHVVIDLQEEHEYPLFIQNYYYFKYLRNELFGINQKSISKILNLIPGKHEARYILAACNDVVENVESEIAKSIPESDYNICSIGRLDKNFLIYGCTEVVKFARKCQDKKINLIFIGDGSEERKNEIRSIINAQDNITLIITGYTYPIPQELLDKMDCYFSSAGSARVSANAGLPTITMSVESEPLGIMYYTTMETLYKPADYQFLDLSKYLEMVLVEHFCDLNTPRYSRPLFDKEGEFKRELSFFGHFEKQYYDVVKNADLTWKEKIYKTLSFAMGGTFFEKFQYALHKAKCGKDV